MKADKKCSKIQGAISFARFVNFSKKLMATALHATGGTAFPGAMARVTGC
jgi:hypothetical protein